VRKVPRIPEKGKIMINIDLSTLVDKPVEDVFAYIGDLNNMPKWNTTVMDVEQITPGDVGVGTKFKSVGEMLGRRIEGEMQVTAYEPDTKFGVQMNAGPALVNMTLSFKAVGTGTEVNLNAQGNPSGLFKLAEPLMQRRVKSIMEENLVRLGSQLEMR
jgi:carbon monoxide dehydrogenase subunit G